MKIDWLTLSLLAGLISGICWLLGDIFLVGFDTEEEKYKDFTQSLTIKNKDMVILMLAGSIKRLRSGALIAYFSIPFMLTSLFSLYFMADQTLLSAIAIGLLGVGFSLSPVAHVAFYYVGTASKNLFDDTQQEKTVNRSLEALLSEYIYFLDITWLAAVGITALGWIVYTFLILFGRTTFPPLFGLLTPLILSPVAGLLTSKLKIGRPYLNGAGLNIGLTIFFIAALAFRIFS